MGVLGTPEPDLYDWAGTEADEGEAAPVDAGRASYREVVRELRARIFAGDREIFSEPPALKAQSVLSDPRLLNADVAVINRAVTQLGAEGILRIGHGRRTIVLERTAWHLEFESRTEPDWATARSVSAAARTAADDHPAITVLSAQPSAHGVLLALTVESADLPGAVTAALPVARQALGSLPIIIMSAGKA